MCLKQSIPCGMDRLPNYSFVTTFFLGYAFFVFTHLTTKTLLNSLITENQGQIEVHHGNSFLGIRWLS